MEAPASNGNNSNFSSSNHLQTPRVQPSDKAATNAEEESEADTEEAGDGGNGKDGEDGKDGENGEDESEKGKQGDKGEEGEEGREGREGEEGEKEQRKRNNGIEVWWTRWHQVAAGRSAEREGAQP